MKKMMFLSLILAGTLGAFAQPEEKLLISAGQLKHLSIGDGMKVTLISAKQVGEIRMDLKVFDRLNVSVSNGLMHVEKRKSASDEPVYIVMDDIETITLGQGTIVNSENVLTSRRIHVFLSEGAEASLKTTGKINATSPDGYGVNIKRTPLKPANDVHVF